FHRACSRKILKGDAPVNEKLSTFALAAALASSPVFTLPLFAYESDSEWNDAHGDKRNVQLGPRPFYLVDKMSPSTLKRKLEQCEEHPFFYKTDFTIGHRGGGTLQFLEHTKESHEAGARARKDAPETSVSAWIPALHAGMTQLSGLYF